MAEEYFKSCTVCGSEKLTVLTKYAKHHLVKCRNCSFVFSSKIPGLRTLVDKYETYTIQPVLSPITAIRYNEMLNYFEPFRKEGNIIDVGCGDGHLLALAKQRGWNVYGTEFTEAKVNFCRSNGINMQKGVLDVKNYSPGTFDVVVSIEVIEHINNPREEVAKFNTLLRPGGMVYLTTPNFNSVSRLFLQEKWNMISYPSHISYYTKKTLCRLFRASGFRVSNTLTTGISFSRAQQSVMAVANWNDIKVTDEKVRQTIERSFFLRVAKKIVNGILNLFRAGDSLKAVFVKQ